MDRIYMDHAAATPVDARVVEEMAPFWSNDIGNPGAIHKEGVRARNAINEARNSVALLLGIHSDEIVFTGSATESANMALYGTVRAWKVAHPKRTAHVIVSAIEHDAVLLSARALEAEGVRVTEISVDGDGIILADQLRAALSEDTVIVSVMYANNEIGTIQPLIDVAKIIRKWKKEVRKVVRTEKPEGEERYPLFHTDACQAVNYLDMHIPRLGVDLLTLSAAKIYGPKGVGMLAIARGTPFSPLVVGGGQEGGNRAGTENVPGIIGLARALQIARDVAQEESLRLAKIRDYAIERLRSLPGVVINGSTERRLPNNVHFSLRDVDHEFLALALDAEGIAVATKSACNELEAEYSHVLLALNAAREGEYPSSGIRLSFGRQTSEEQVDVLLRALARTQERMLTPLA